MADCPESVSSALRAALKMENDGSEMYQEAAGKCTNGLGKKMFYGLAEDEKSHIRMIKVIAEGSGLSAALVEALDGTPRERIATIFSRASEGVVENAAGADDVSVLKTALALEDKSREFYGRAAQEVSCGDEAALFERLAREEEQHHEILTNTLEYLESTGNWFLWEEGGLLDGG
jgi:rubrerythrin